MTSDNSKTDAAAAIFKENLARIDVLTSRLTKVLSEKPASNPALEAPGQELFAKAASAFAAEVMANPNRLFEQQIGYWATSLKALTGEAEGTQDAPKDRRFANPMWDTHPFFKYVKEQYNLNSHMMKVMTSDVQGLTPSEQARLDYFTAQLTDMISPTNFLPTNPDALEEVINTNGDSLVQGLENLVRDLEANNGDMLVTLADRAAFKVGENLATTPGGVVFANHMFELIQYAPTTPTVHRTPLVIFPPWINKFYVMDLTEHNSLIKWLVGQGHTVFVVSWVNPDASYADIGIEDYITDGYLAAIQQVKQRCNVKQVNAIGYCIAGTTLSLVLALLKARGDKSVRSATLLTTLTDFSDQGEFVGFLGDDFVGGIEAECARVGVLDKFYTARAFSYLRPNDLVYGPAIRAYFMGKSPPKFDLLYWNGDGTNLPGRMTVEYLRGLCQANKFADGGIELCGHRLKLSDIGVPICAVGCETDHIAAWKASFNGVAQMRSRNRTFILSQSGHVAGIINPPHKKKYGHFTGLDLKKDPQAALDGAEFQEGSWWPTWDAWAQPFCGKQVPAREVDDAIVPAPGRYVLD